MPAATKPPPPFSPGDLLEGKYRIERAIACGGMGFVMAARHETLGQRVALKFLLPEFAGEPESAERFLREARMAAQLQSDHVVRVFDVASPPGGPPYIVMEYLDGTDLENEMATRGAWPIAEAIDLVLQLLDGVIDAHELGIVHRDLKPSNVFLATRPDGSRRVKVLDFGISKAPRSGAVRAGSRTTTSSQFGSPAYMSPEHVVSTRDVDARTDLWSLGVILYELLSGAPAFQGETVGAVFVAIHEKDLPAIRSVRPEVPEELGRVLHQCLERDRTKRWARAKDLRAALTPFGSAGGPHKRLSSLDVPASEQVHPASVATTIDAETRPLAVKTDVTWSSSKASRGSIVPLALVALAIAGGSVLAWRMLWGGAAPSATEPVLANPVASEATSARSDVPAVASSASETADPPTDPGASSSARPTVQPRGRLPRSPVLKPKSNTSDMLKTRD